MVVEPEQEYCYRDPPTASEEGLINTNYKLYDLAASLGDVRLPARSTPGVRVLTGGPAIVQSLCSSFRQKASKCNQQHITYTDDLGILNLDLGAHMRCTIAGNGEALILVQDILGQDVISPNIHRFTVSFGLRAVFAKTSIPISREL